VGLGLLFAAAAATWAAAFLLFPPARTATGPARGGAASAAEPVPAPTRHRAGTPPAFAVADGVRLHVSEGLMAMAFHEASYGDAVAMRPLGRCTICRNRTKFRPPPSVDRSLEYIVMDTRGRDLPATSAVDLVMARGAIVRSPVTGTVAAVRRYRLYGEHPDVRLTLLPAGVPDRRVVAIHLEGVRLSPGDQVVAGRTPLGTARRFGFESQVDRYVPGRLPHTHVEVKNPAARRSPLPS
jgi:hypothetical protein